MKYILILTLMILPLSAYPQKPIKLSTKASVDRNKQLMEISDKIKEFYIFEDVAKTLSSKLKSEIENKTFDNLSDQEFANALSAYLTKNGNDRHFNVLYRPDYEQNPVTDEKELMKRYDTINRRYNYGFEKVMRLDGNIGYIQYTGFPDDNESATKALEATMNFVSNTNSLILDLRNNNGGSGEMVEVFLSYFFDKKIQLSESYTRYNNSKSKSYTKEKVNGQRYLNKPIYILVNKRTISAAEALAYDLQQRKIATVLGESTYGAANPIKAFFIDNKFHLFIPITSGKNTATNTNWEHVGVIPDKKVKSDNALNEAHILALENLPMTNYVDQNELNTVGYNLLGQKNIKEAIRVFKINVEKFPDSWNAHSSLGEGYLMSKDYELSLKSYKQSVKLNPNNNAGKEAIIKIEKIIKDDLGSDTSQMSEEDKVRITLNNYLMGHKTRKAEYMKKAFHTEGKLIFIRDGKYTTWDFQDYIGRFRSENLADDEDQRTRTIESIDISGNAAIAKLVLDYPTTRYVDYASLLKIDGEWKIVSKVFYAEPKEKMNSKKK